MNPLTVSNGVIQGYRDRMISISFFQRASLIIEETSRMKKGAKAPRSQL
jgi:hypothetical protein